MWRSRGAGQVVAMWQWGRLRSVAWLNEMSTLIRWGRLRFDGRLCCLMFEVRGSMFDVRRWVVYNRAVIYGLGLCLNHDLGGFEGLGK